MKIEFLFSLLFLSLNQMCSQNTPPDIHTSSPAFDKELHRILSFSVPIMSVEELELLMNEREDVQILDAREVDEYEVSHISGAACIGYEDWDKKLAKKLDPTKPTVVYCSVGYRSEKIAERLQAMGFEDVHNLYGSLFEWVNSGRAVVSSKNQVTKDVHTYDENWSKWVINPEVRKVF